MGYFFDESYSNQSFIYLWSDTVKSWLNIGWVQTKEFVKNQGKHPVRIKWLHGI